MSDPNVARRRGRSLLLGAIGLALAIGGGRLLSGALVEVLWFRSVGYSDVFWKLIGLRALSVVLIGGVAGVLTYLTLSRVARGLGRVKIRRQFGNLEIVEQLPGRYVAWATGGISALLGLWFGLSAPRDLGLRTVLSTAAGSWGQVDPVMGKDLSFYVFRLPLLESLGAFALVLVFLLLFVSVAGYAATDALSFRKGKFHAEPGALAHVCILLAAFLALTAGQLWLSRYDLLVDGTSRVSGMFGYVDQSARLPGLTGLALGCLVAAGATVWAGRQGRLTVVAGVLLSTIVGGLALVQVFPSLIQRFEVDPNELERESPFIRWNLEATRTAFGLDRMEPEPFPYQGELPVDWDVAQEQIDGFPTWNRDALLATFQSLEARFRYYRFSGVTIDRYPAGGRHQAVALSVRELDPRGIENPNWQNLHLRERFVQGAGAVAASATDATSEGRPEIHLASIPPTLSSEGDTPQGLSLERPGIFFGNTDQRYAVLTPNASQFLAPDGSPGDVGQDLPRGIPLASRLVRLALAWAYQDPNLFFSSEIDEASQFLLHRQVVDRARRIAPFLAYLENPQAVIHNGRVVWILDGFTSSRHYPLSSRFSVPFRLPVNYVRASVKVTVDAVTGEVRLYAVDPADPILQAYRRVLPTLFYDLDQWLRRCRPTSVTPRRS